MISPSPLQAALEQLLDRRDLSAEQMAEVVGRMMDGEATQAQIAALLTALRMKGETVDEVVGAARAMRARATRLRVPDGVVVDTCGTGGDGAGTLNVSTLAALTVAACGVRVAKHGNRAQSSRSGSADLLEALGVNIAAKVATVERCLAEVGIGFLFAPAFHGATRAAVAVRRELGVRTLFNLLGPLTNPAGVRHQVVGVYAREWVEPVARALGHLGAERALVVHGTYRGRGLDEVSPSGPTLAVEWREGRAQHHELSPASFGLEPADEDGEDGLAGGAPQDNAARALRLLSGAERSGPAHRAVVMAAACALCVAGQGTLREGAEAAAAALQAGRPAAVLKALIEVSQA